MLVNLQLKTRRYILVYRNIEHDELSFETIEKVAKTIRTHCNMADSCKGLIERVWLETYSLLWIEQEMHTNENF